MTDPEHEPSPALESDGIPKFGRLLMVLACAVLLIVVITFASAAYYQ